MKKFKKSIVAVFLTCVLGIGLIPGSVVAEGVFGAGDVYDTNAKVNGEEIVLKSFYSYYGPYIQYAPVMRALGYEVTYNGESHSVVSDNGETRVEIFLEQDENGFTKIWVTKNGEQREYYNLRYACEMDGIAYVGRGYGIWDSNSDWYNIWDRAYNVWVRFTDYTYFIDTAALKADVVSKLSHLKEIPAYALLNPDYTSRADGTISFDLNSDLFGINIAGESEITTSVTKKGDAVMLDYQMDNGGIMNVYSLLCGPFTLGLDYYKDKIDLEQPVSAQVIFDGTDVYGKGDFFVETFALQNLGSYYNYPEDNDFREIAAERIDGKWIKAWLTDMQKQLIVQPILESMQGEQLDTEKLADIIVNETLNYYNYYYYPGNLYEKIIARIDATVDLLGPETIQYKEANGEKVITYHLTTDTLRAYLKACMSAYETGAIYDEMELDITEQTTIAADNTATSTIDGTFRINNIPNDYNIPFGSLEIQIDMSGTNIPQASAVSAPADYVDFEQLYNESLLYRFNGI